MIKPEIRDMVRTLFLQNKSLREISEMATLSRNTVRRIVRAVEQPPVAKDNPDVPPDLKGYFARARGNVVRLQQLLRSERGQDVAYSTLTRWVREAELREVPERVGDYVHPPGAESQHDTSPHKVCVGGKMLTAQCAALILAYSRRLYVRYYPRYGRLEAKDFLLQATRFMDGACEQCVIDNSSVILAGGAGEDAIIAPEMQAFGRTLGFRFKAHRVNDPDRKGRIERSFRWIETNFLPGRTFASFADLNDQALQWCREVANVKPKRALGMSPDAAYVLEKPYLKPLPSALPPVYEVLERVVDSAAFFSVDTNRYSLPERFIGKSVSVYKYPGQLQVYHRGQLIATHPRVLDRREARQVLPQHHQPLTRTERAAPPEESKLRAVHPLVDRYVQELTRPGRSRPVQPRRALKRLAEIQRIYPDQPFLAAVEKALNFGLYDLGRLETLVLKYVSGEFFSFGDDQERDDDSETPVS